MKKSNRDVARGWFSKAENDLACVRVLLNSGGPYDIACFHCQQVAEKYLKGFLAYHNVKFPFVHDLKQLLPLCKGADATLVLDETAIEGLTDYAVASRYDNTFSPPRDEVEQALAAATNLRNAFRSRLPEVCP